jgi:molecular chaperone GrpE
MMETTANTATTGTNTQAENHSCNCHDNNDNNDNSCSCQNGSQSGCSCQHGIPAPANAEPTLEEKCAMLQDQYLRLAAEFDNFRKRSAKERLEMLSYANEDLMLALLPAIDDMERAIAAETMPQGIMLVYQKLLNTLSSKGLQVIDTSSADFDPDQHNAISRMPAPAADMKGKIIDVIEKGYKLGDKIIRYPKVVVGE